MHNSINWMKDRCNLCHITHIARIRTMGILENWKLESDLFLAIVCHLYWPRNTNTYIIMRMHALRMWLDENDSPQKARIIQLFHSVRTVLLSVCVLWPAQRHEIIHFIYISCRCIRRCNTPYTVVSLNWHLVNSCHRQTLSRQWCATQHTANEAPHSGSKPHSTQPYMSMRV